MPATKSQSTTEAESAGHGRRIAPPPGTLGGFAVRVIVAIVLGALALLVWTLRDVLLLLFAAILVAVILRAAADGLRRMIPMGEGLSLLVAGLLILAIIGLAAGVFGQEVSRQVTQLGSVLPAAWEDFQAWLAGHGIEMNTQNWIPDGQMIAGWLQGLMSTTTAVLTGLVLAIVGGVYLAINPRSYVNGTLCLLPRSAREPVGEFFSRSGRSLRRWLLARLVAMLLIGGITYVGLLIIGVPSALALGIIAGFLEFVPFAGPILSAVPALLLALTIDFNTFLLTLGLYVLVQQIEGNLLTPLLLDHAVDLPPALTLFALFLFGALFGVVGVLLAGPLTVVAFIAVKSLWMDRTLNEDVEYVADG